AIVFLPMIPAVGFLSVGNSGGIAGLVQAVVVVIAVAVSFNEWERYRAYLTRIADDLFAAVSK
ncbi:MAG TPA: hypothetical protein VFH51_06010, partial [Myxococcota bacterium]|nr:hypothetical protein [Myxococcota bacterium]